MTRHDLLNDTPALKVSESQKQRDYNENRRRYWDEFCRESSGWQPLRAFYQKRLADIYRFLIPPGMCVLEVRCSRGDLLAAVSPSYAVRGDLYPSLIPTSDVL